MTFTIDKKTTKKEFENLLSSFNKSKKKGVDLSKHTGVLKLSKDALLIQKEMRDEWK